MSDQPKWASEYRIRTPALVLPRAMQRRVDKAAQEADDRAKTTELNARVEGLTGEASHLEVRKGMVYGFDVESLEACLRQTEDRALGIPRS